MTRKIITAPDAPAPVGPYNHAVEVTGGRTLYVSGQVALDPASGTVVGEGDLTIQTNRVLDNLQAILKAGGMDFANVVKTTIYLASMDDFAAVNAIYAKRFDADTAPARATIQVGRLPLGLLVEIDAIAVAD